MREQDAGPASIQIRLPQESAKLTWIAGFAVMHADDLQSANVKLLVVQNADAGALHGTDEFGAIGEFVVIAGDIINPGWGG